MHLKRFSHRMFPKYASKVIRVWCAGAEKRSRFNCFVTKTVYAGIHTFTRDNSVRFKQITRLYVEE